MAAILQWHFWLRFPERKILYLYLNFTAACFNVTQYIRINSENSLAPNRQQIITWSMMTQFVDVYMCKQALMCY